MKTKTVSKVFTIIFALGLSVMAPRVGWAYSVYVDASGTVPTVSSDNPFFFPVGGMSSLWGPSTITSIGANAWDLRLIFAGSNSASFGSSNRGLDLLEPGTGKLLNSLSFNYYQRDTSFFLNTDLVIFDAYLYTSDAFGNPSSESARCPALCMTKVYDGTPQLAMQGMSTAYGAFDVYLTGTPPQATTVPEPDTYAMLLLGLGLVGLIRGLKPSHYTHLPALYPIVLDSDHTERADELGEAGV